MKDDETRCAGDSRMLREVWSFVDAQRRLGGPVVLARLVGRDGPGARPLGATMAVAGDGTWRGSLSGGCVEGFVLDAALSVLNGAKHAHLLSFVPSDQFLPWEDVPACSGELRVLITPAPTEPVYSAITTSLAQDTPLAIRIDLRFPYTWTIDSEPGGLGSADPAFTEVVGSRRRLVLVGATDLAAVMACFADALHLAVVVLDPRPRYIGSGAFPTAVTRVRTWPDQWLTAHPLDENDALVALSHDPRIDDDALRAALAGNARYVAALGSRATHAQRVQRLAGTVGLDRLRGPVGLDLGGITLAETALSILGELVATDNGRMGGSLHLIDRPIHTHLGAAHANGHTDRVCGDLATPDCQWTMFNRTTALDER